MIKVLVTNDDGIKAEGISKLVEVLKEKAEVYIVAPNGQRSACGHGISIAKDVILKEVEYDGAVKALECSGTPVDCVKLGLTHLAINGIDIDMVFSGINHGGNLGTDTLYSGTVSAAMEAALCDVPALAFSINSHSPKHYEYVIDLIRDMFDGVCQNLKPGTVLNINVPNKPKEEIKGLKYTKLGRREYEEWLTPVESESGDFLYKYEGRPKVYDSKDLRYDVIAMQEGYASLTPLQFDLTDHVIAETIWERE